MAHSPVVFRKLAVLVRGQRPVTPIAADGGGGDSPRAGRATDGGQAGHRPAVTRDDDLRALFDFGNHGGELVLCTERMLAAFMSNMVLGKRGPAKPRA